MQLIELLPQVLRAPTSAYLSELQPHLAAIAPEPQRLEQLVRVLALSPYSAQVLVRNEAVLQQMLTGSKMDHCSTRADYQAALAAELDDGIEVEELKLRLRRFRHRELTRLVWQDINGLLDIDQVLFAQSELAAAILDAALDALQRQLAGQWGRPIDEDGSTQQLIVIGMGKLGGYELNFSSDIDLIFIYPRNGDTVGGKRSETNQEFFTRLAKQLIKLLSERTADGFVYRVDMRLRPFGDSGPLVMSAAAFEAYIETHARDWERYALIKARPVAGDQQAGAVLLMDIAPFIYRRHLDFTALGALRDMKQRIVEQVQVKGLEDNIKLGAGGIREIEFIGQAFQLIYGGKREALRQRSILATLAVLRDDLMPADAVDELTHAYRYLRRLENRIQQIADQQTHELPENELDRARIQFATDHADWPGCLASVAAQRQCVQRHFNALLGPTEAQRGGEASDILHHIWIDDAPGETILEELAEYGFQHPKDILDALLVLKNSRRIRALGAESRARFEAFMPQLLLALTEYPDPTIVLERLLPLLEILGQRSVYLALLMEQPKALSSLLKLTAASKWFSEQITRQPLLLDELLDARTLAKPPGPEQLAMELQRRLSNAPADDMEARMDALRQFKHAQVLRISAADVLGTLPLAEVSNHLSFVAESVLEGARQLAWTDLTARHGRPSFFDDSGSRREAGFAVIAYGKLGGLELGYGSDLDLIFLHDSRGSAAHTEGGRSIDNQTFFTRMGQRLIHYLTTQTAAGRCYEIDTRLRPSGNAGLLVTGLNAFEQYQLNEAWTWEHQALIRARAVAGDAPVRKNFAAIRRHVLCLQRDPARLRDDILTMRERMRKQLDRSDAEYFDLKQGPGGMTDIEFLVQYVTLRWAHSWPALVDVTDNLRLLDALDEFQIIGSDSCAVMYNAYFAYRAEAHKAALQEDAALVPSSALREHREGVQRLWAQLERGEL